MEGLLVIYGVSKLITGAILNLLPDPPPPTRIPYDPNKKPNAPRH